MTITEDVEPTSRGTHRLRRLLAIAAIAAAVAAVAGTGRVGWTWRHPEAFSDLGFSTDLITWTAGESFYVPLSYGVGRNGSVTVHSLRVADLHGPRTDTDFFICSAKIGAANWVGGADRQAVDETCATLGPAEGHRYRLDGSQLLLLRMTPEEPGDLALSAVDIEYSDGWRRGHQHIGPPFTAHVVG